MIRTLLLGKFPPNEGGIASKTWHLARALKKMGVDYQVVGVELPREYSTPRPKNFQLFKSHFISPCEKMPWTLPISGNCGERLANYALGIIEEFQPHIIESNYLSPYAFAANWLAKQFNLPLLLRHAGSDIVKLLSHKHMEKLLKRILSSADMVISPLDSELNSMRRTLPQVNWRLLERYIPDPYVFQAMKPSSQDPCRLVYAGKCNYYWQLRGLDLAAQAVMQADNWKLSLVSNGNGMEKAVTDITTILSQDKLEIIPFVSPDDMPFILNSASAIWSWEGEGGIYDVSNVIWEATACDTPVIIRKGASLPPDCSILRHNLIPVENSPRSIARVLANISGGTLATEFDDFRYQLERRYENYIHAQYQVYAGLVK